MDEKKKKEDFRLRQYSGKEASTSEVGTYSALEPDFRIDTRRCILHFDADAFYAQVWRLDGFVSPSPSCRTALIRLFHYR